MLMWRLWKFLAIQILLARESFWNHLSFCKFILEIHKFFGLKFLDILKAFRLTTARLGIRCPTCCVDSGRKAFNLEVPNGHWKCIFNWKIFKFEHFTFWRAKVAAWNTRKLWNEKRGNFEVHVEKTFENISKTLKWINFCNESLKF